MNISIIIEWENVLLRSDSREVEMLKEVFSQVLRARYNCQILFLYDSNETSEKKLQDLLDKSVLSEKNKPIDYRFQGVTDKSYYELKNYGARIANGDVLVFIDSDVIPNENWLDEIVTPIFTNTAEFVAGFTCVEYNTWYEKAFALGWLFPPPKSTLTCHYNNKYFYANNFAVTKKVFKQYSFPSQKAGVGRGACVELASILREKGIKICTNEKAFTKHPPPVLGWHFFLKALAMGKDEVMKASKKNIVIRLYKITRSSVAASANGLYKTLKNFNIVGASLAQIPLFIFTMGLFYSVYFIGGVLTAFQPSYFKKKWKV